MNLTPKHIERTISETAIALLSSSQRSHVQEALRHATVSLCEVDRFDLVLRIFSEASLPPYWTAICASAKLGNVAEGLHHLKQMIDFRQTGWGAIPPHVLRTLRYVANCVGRHGTPSEVSDFASLLRRFKTPRLPANRLIGFVAVSASRRNDAVVICKAVADSITSLSNELFATLRASAAELSVPFASLLSALHSDEKTWSCIACCSNNPSESTFCAYCGAYRAPYFRCQKCGACNLDNNKCACGFDEKVSIPRLAWTCTACSTWNPDFSVDNCVKCSQPRVISGTRDTAPKVDEWSCQCRNLHSVAMCTECGQLSPALSATSETEVWMCDACNKWNPWFTSICPTCNSTEQTPACPRRSTNPVPCASCKTNNSPLRFECSACEAPLPVHKTEAGNTCCGKKLAAADAWCPTCFQVRKGLSVHLWLCTNCDTPSPSTVSQCRSCSAPRTQDTETATFSPSICSHCSHVHSPEYSDVLCSGCGEATVGPHLLQRGGTPESRWNGVLLEQTLRRLRVSESVSTISKHVNFLLSHEHGFLHHTKSVEKIAAAAILHSRSQCSISSTIGRDVLAATGRIAEWFHLSFSAEGRCKYCYGTHPVSLCPTASKEWQCSSCETLNSTDGCDRLVCRECLSLRDEVLATDNWYELWQCPGCQRAQPLFDDQCSHCGHIADVTLLSQQDATIPFSPSRCGVCGGVHLEALCPRCSDVTPLTTIANGRGFVCILNDQYGLIQPWGTFGPQRRVVVPREIVISMSLVCGEDVQFSANTSSVGTKLKATVVQRLGE